MKALKRLKNKKGLSTLFSSLYLFMIAITLLSMLFVAQTISSTSLAEQMRLEQERRQERVALVGPGALNITQGTIVHKLRVNNTGSIPIRLRALYIGHKFVCDPSQFEGGAYLEPKEGLWIQLYPNTLIVLNDSVLSDYWTVTTERGTSASETGINLLLGSSPDDPYFKKRFYVGPFMLIFDMFHWRSGTGPWRSGWTIPKGTTDVTWRILVANVDDRDIIIEETSCFTLISNENSPKDPLPFYIDPVTTGLTFEPGVFHFVHYTWSKPASVGGAKQQDITGMAELTSCINFLTFYGSFVEPNGTFTPLGETIPFEAVLVTSEAMAESLELVSKPINILNDGVATSDITVLVLDESGQPVPDAPVDFYTTAGILSTPHLTTDASGKATITLRASLSQTTAHITAVCQSVHGFTSVSFTPATHINMNAVPSTIDNAGGTAIITVQLVDSNGTDVMQAGITLTVEVSSWTGTKSKTPTLTYGAQTGSAVIVVTDAEGKAHVTLTGQNGVGTVTITAAADGLQSGSTEVAVT